MSSVKAPVPDFEGVVAGVAFTGGRAETTDVRALAYFRRKGYIVDGETTAPPAPEPPDPRLIGTDGDGIEPVGTKLRDAAVDPRPSDFMPPTNAGEANPHGPDVVAPGVHAAPPTPITPGPVSSDPKVQEAVETAAAGAVLAQGAPVGEVTDAVAEANKDGLTVADITPTEDGGVTAELERPAKSAKVAEWRAYAVAQGMTEEEAGQLTKDELIDAYPDDA